MTFLNPALPLPVPFFSGEEGTESKVSTYPHTLPSAMCAISGGGEFSALYGGYSALPPIEGAYSALPPIETTQEPGKLTSSPISLHWPCC